MPPAVAIVGASNDRSKYGNKSVRAHRKAGYTVYPVHPTETRIEGLPAFPSLASLPGPVERVSMYVAPRIGIGMLEQVAAVAAREFFLNPGSDSPELVARAEQLGLKPILACSILDLGEDPAELPD
jgi:uncharacterized protein